MSGPGFTSALSHQPDNHCILLERQLLADGGYSFSFFKYCQHKFEFDFVYVRQDYLKLAFSGVAIAEPITAVQQTHCIT